MKKALLLTCSLLLVSFCVVQGQVQVVYLLAEEGNYLSEGDGEVVVKKTYHPGVKQSFTLDCDNSICHIKTSSNEYLIVEDEEIAFFGTNIPPRREFRKSNGKLGVNGASYMIHNVPKGLAREYALYEKKEVKPEVRDYTLSFFPAGEKTAKTYPPGTVVPDPYVQLTITYEYYQNPTSNGDYYKSSYPVSTMVNFKEIENNKITVSLSQTVGNIIEINMGEGPKWKYVVLELIVGGTSREVGRLSYEDFISGKSLKP